MRPLTTITRTALAAVLVALGSLAAVPLALAPASAASADEGDVSWGVRTAANDQGADRQNFGYEIDPGGSVTDALVVSNRDVLPLNLALYGADGFTTDAGQLDVVTAGTDSVAVGAWLDFDAASVTVQPGESVEVPFTMTVPNNATPGDYAGAVITSLTQPSPEQGINVDRRLGVRIHLRVGGTLAPALAVDAMRVDYTGTFNPFGAGEAVVTYTLRNSGNARLSARQKVTVSGPFGMLASDAHGIEKAPELLPGESWDMTVRVAGVIPSFLLTAATSVSLESPSSDASDPAIAPVEASATTWAVPWATLVLLALVAAIVVATVALGRRRRRAVKSREDARVEQAVQQALLEREERPSLVP